MHIHQDYRKFGPKERVGFSLCFVLCKRGGPETNSCLLTRESLLIPKPTGAFSKNDLSLYYLKITHVILFVKLKETVMCFLQTFIWILKLIFFLLCSQCLWCLPFQGIPTNSMASPERIFFSANKFFVCVFIIIILITEVFRDANQAMSPIMADQIRTIITAPETWFWVKYSRLHAWLFPMEGDISCSCNTPSSGLKGTQGNNDSKWASNPWHRSSFSFWS